ncbi:MAG: arsenite methyltransferase [Acidimicrobiia bacterium]
MTTHQIREDVRDRYARAAQEVKTGSLCCTDDDCFGSTRYDDGDLAELPEAAVSASLGCGNPVLMAELSPGETVLDLGSGGGIDVLLSARRVGLSGKAYGLDMTREMLDLARRNAAEAGVDNVEFLEGNIEQIPLPDATVDVVISNCVINLSPEKPKVFSEIARVLRPGGRLAISDVVAEDHLTPADRAERGSWAECTAGALSISEYCESLRDTGLLNVSVQLTQQVEDGMHAAIIRAERPQPPSCLRVRKL